VATLPVGHADGWPRNAALAHEKGAKVRINGDLYPVIASVSASHCILEIGREERVKIGDTATFFDWQPGSRPEDVSESCGASVYDLTAPEPALAPPHRVTLRITEVAEFIAIKSGSCHHFPPRSRALQVHFSSY